MFAQLLKTDDIILHPIMRLYYRHKYGAKGVVYMLHRVGRHNSSGIVSNENLKVTPGRLEQVIRSYRKQGFDFLSLDQLYDTLHGIRKQKNPFLVFTMDDGYIDNYTEAYPVFKKYNIPFCIYVATDFPDNKAFLWWYALEDYLKGEDNKDEKFAKLRAEILSLPKENFINNVQNLLFDYNLDVEKYIQKESMTWDQIVELSKDPLCTIGGHTVSHPAFKTLSEEDIMKEITNGCRIIEQHIQKPVNHFSYPYGSLNEVAEREYKITEQYGFKTIVTTLQGVVTPYTNINRIPRYMLY